MALFEKKSQNGRWPQLIAVVRQKSDQQRGAEILMHRPWLAGCAHGTTSIESILSELIDKLAQPFVVLSCKVPARFTCLAVVMIRAGRSAMESKIMVTIPCQFSSSWGSNKCHVCLLAKSIVWVLTLPPGGLSESPTFTKISCKRGHGLSRKKKTRCGIACVPGYWKYAIRFVLVVSFLIDGSACARRPDTHTLHTIHTHTHSTVKERCLAWFVKGVLCSGGTQHPLVRCCKPRGRWSGSEESRELVALFGKTCRSGTAGCSRPAAMTFRQCSKVTESRTAQIYSRAFMIRVLELDLSLDLISKTPLRSCRSTCCRENTWMYVLPYSLTKKTQGQQRRQAARLKESAKQLLFWSGQWSSDSSCSATDGRFDIGLGKTLGNGEFPSLDQSAPVCLYCPPGPFLATQYD